MFLDPQLVGFLGTALSALVAAGSYYAKTRHERRRTTRTTLYYLLEVHHLLARSQFGVETFPKHYVEKIRSLLATRSVVISDAEVETLTTVLERCIRTLARSEIEDLQASIAEPFESALIELSRDDPLLAFELRGKDSVANVPKLLELIGALPSPEASQSEDADAAHALVTYLDDRARAVAVKELSRCIRSTAWRCDAITHIRVLRHLRKASRVRSIDNISPEISAMLGELAAKIEQQSKVQRGEA